MIARTDRQELNFISQMNCMNSEYLELFAYQAAVTINRGHVYRFAQQLGVNPLEITTEFGRDLQHLDRVGNLADVYGKSDKTEFRHSAWLAFSCFGLGMETVIDSIHSDATMLKSLGPTSRFARAVVEWRRLLAASEPPPVESVACQIGHHFGVDVDEYSVADIVRDLGDAFAPGCACEPLWDVVADRRGALVTPELCRGIAEAAVGALSG